MLKFQWRRTERPGHGVLWELLHNGNTIGRCFWLSGSKRWRCSASAPVAGGVVLTDYYAGSASQARGALERDWDKRSLGLFGEDDISFEMLV